MKKLYLLSLLIFLLFIGYTVASQMIMRTIPSSGVMAYGDLEFYSDPAGTQIQTTIDWGVCYVSETVTRSGYIKNTGNVPVTLLFNTTNWTPTNDTNSDYDLTTNFEGLTLQADEIILAEFYFTPLPVSRNYTYFSFDINLIGDDGR